MGHKHDNPTRTVCVAIPYDPKTGLVLMITSQKHPTKWIFPKGGLEKGETLVEAAIRESWEEAGTPQHLPHIPLSTPAIYSNSCLSNDQARRIDYHIFELPLDSSLMLDEWLESHRQRSWLTPREAFARCAAWQDAQARKDEAEGRGERKRIEFGEGLRRCLVWKEGEDGR